MRISLLLTVNKSTLHTKNRYTSIRTLLYSTFSAHCMGHKTMTKGCSLAQQ